jgi:predicted ArsR family transcriptional regulator
MTPVKVLSRQRYIAYLRKNQTATVAELARDLQVTPANVRHHLSALQDDGLVVQIESRKGQKGGRPVKVFGLSQAVKGDNLSRFADVLLSELIQNKDGNELAASLERIAEKMADQASPIQGPFSRRLGIIVEFLNQRNYSAHWEAHGSGPRIIFEQCPYAGMAAVHPELCRIDLFFLEKLLGREVEQLAVRERGMRNVPICLFALSEID